MREITAMSAVFLQGSSRLLINTCNLDLGSILVKAVNKAHVLQYEGESISDQPIPFSIDRDGHDFHALFQYMFYMWVQNWTLIESFLIRY